MKFFILCDVIFLVRPQEKFDIDHSWESKGFKLFEPAHPNIVFILKCYATLR